MSKSKKKSKRNPKREQGQASWEEQGSSNPLKDIEHALNSLSGKSYRHEPILMSRRAADFYVKHGLIKESDIGTLFEIIAW